MLTGHFDLAIGAIAASGIGSDYVRRCADVLDTGAAVGVLALTELGGTNGANQQTVAAWDGNTNGFRLSTPCIRAAKFMPNVADPTVPKVAVVTARLMMEGRDQGVFPFLLPIRDSAGALARGVSVATLPEKAGSAMDHGLIEFNDCWMPAESLLGGGWARIEGGRLKCDVPQEQRFARTITVLGDGRLDLANAAIASARAALAAVVNYAGQRRPGVTLMIDRGPVQRDLAIGLASVYATSVLGRRVRDMFATGTAKDVSLWPAVVKPLLSELAYDVLVMCRRRAGAQGTLRTNRIADWMANADGIATAEGDNQIMQVAAGKGYSRLVELQLPGAPADLPWYVNLLAERERTIADGVRRGNFGTAGPVWGWDSAAAELATATGERLAATALAIAAEESRDTAAGYLIGSLASAYALDRIYEHGSWYAGHNLLSTERASEICGELTHSRSLIVDHFSELVTAFDVPMLPGAPLFARDYTASYGPLSFHHRHPAVTDLAI
ncbi:acyl-CoA dehydrogenase family protein [Nocardia aobensis]|uniref:acyl-CoA dehydrogenase family protein n=1 Tax=Nocardia aobensis TaxID=257277 RepID=UPI0012F64FB1|nr:acyl-CoA dehydrogenase family protein [Nocardia aobensis]